MHERQSARSQRIPEAGGDEPLEYPTGHLVAASTVVDLVERGGQRGVVGEPRLMVGVLVCLVGVEQVRVHRR